MSPRFAASGSIRKLHLLVWQLAPEVVGSRRFLTQVESRFCLKDRYQIDGLQITIVLFTFLGRQSSLIGLFREIAEPLLNLIARPQIDDFLSNVRRETRDKWIEQLVKW